MELMVEKAGDVAVVTPIVDELDAGNVAEFKREMAPLVEAESRVVLDLAGLRFVDSSGLGAFLSILRKLNAKRGDLKLCRVTDQVRTVLELVRLHRVLDVHATREAALSAFAGAA
jgi:anti-sigma B factor antagonist